MYLVGAKIRSWIVASLMGIRVVENSAIYAIYVIDSMILLGRG